MMIPRSWTPRFMLGLALASTLVAYGPDTSAGTRLTPAPVAAPASAAAPMPAALRASYLAARQKAGGAAYRFDRAPSGSAAGRNEAHRLDVTLAAGALRVTRTGDAAWHLGIQWTGIGRGARIAPVARPDGDARVADNRASYRRADGSEEQYVNGPLGVEQGFVLPARPAGAAGAPLAIDLTASGDLAPELVEGGAAVTLRDARGVTVARYTDLAAFDADGVERRSWIEVSGPVVRLRVDDDGARYPLRIDPLLWTQQAEPKAGDGAAGDQLGHSVAVSGGTAIVGAPDHQVGSDAQRGAAYVFVQSGAAWTQQAELTASDGGAYDNFGFSVSVSGGTAIVGGNAATAYVFVRSGAAWTQQAKLTASDAASGSGLGYAVSVSGDTAIVGAAQHNVGSHGAVGAAYVFARSGTTWTQQAMLTAGDGLAGDAFGEAVSVSGDTAIVGAPARVVGGDNGAGVAYVFVRSGATWAQQAELTVSDYGDVGDAVGASVSVSGDTAILGAPYHQVGSSPSAGAAYVFVRSGAAWTQQAELTASDAANGNGFGFGVSVSGDAAIIGAPVHFGSSNPAGVAYLFARSGTAWTQQAKITAGDGAAQDGFGGSVSVSEGAAIVGAELHGAAAGAAYVFEVSCAGQSDGVACDDGDACTQTDTCKAGVCGGANPVTCSTPDECHDPGTCDPTSGACSTTAKPDGAACTGGTCKAGVCSSSSESSSSGGSSTGTPGSGCAGAAAPVSSPPLGLVALGALLGLAARRRRRARAA